MKEKITKRLEQVESERAFYQKQIDDSRAGAVHPIVVHLRILTRHYQQEAAFLRELLEDLK